MDFEDRDTMRREDLEYERQRKARMRRREIAKRKQMRRRKMIRMGVIAAVAIAVTAFGGTALVRTISKAADEASKADAQTVQAEVPERAEAVLQPVIDANNIAKFDAVSVGWQTDANGTWYRHTDGSFYVSGWKDIDGATYYFDENGYRATGWLALGDDDFFFSEEGVYDESVKKPMVALTFDDGPGQFTDRLLDCLEENNAKATFFMLGQNAEAFPDIVKRELDLGMELGNHSYNHTILTRTDSNGVLEQMSKTQNALAAACGTPATVMRPPGGAYDENVLSLLDLPVIMWSIDTLDWKTKNAQSVMEVTLNNVTDGSIVLMHDIHESTVDAACMMIPELISRGFKLVTISEMAKAKGITLEGGGVVQFMGEGDQMVE